MFPNNKEQKQNTEIPKIDTEVQSDKENTCDTPPEIVTIETSDQEPETAWDQQSDWGQRNDDSQDGSKDCSDCDRISDASLWPKFVPQWAEFVVSSMKPEDIEDNSPSRLEWLRQKREENERNVCLDQLMTMVGLENVKAHFLAVKAKFKASKQAHAGHEKLRLHLVLHGKDGTGKKSIAQLYAQFLFSIGVVADNTFSRTSELYDRNGHDKYDYDDGYYPRKHPTVIFYDISGVDSDNFCYSRVVSNAIENMEESVVIVSSRMKPLLEAIEDNYNDDELHQLSVRMMQKVGFSLKGGFKDGSVRAFVHRVARARESEWSEWFSNVYHLQWELNQARKRRLLRLQGKYMRWFGNSLVPDSQVSCRQRNTETDTSDNPKAIDSIGEQETVFIPEDLLGPEPKDARLHNASWKKLQSMIGLKNVKRECGDVIDFAQINYQRELLGGKPLKVGLNRVFLGPPGVGKTTVAELYGQVLVDLGLVTGKEVMVCNPSHLIGRLIGESEQNTLDILNQAKGNVLIIDDAHMLYPGSETDTFRVAVLDTIVANVSADPEGRCIILVGYEHEMVQLFNNSNPGLQRRFPKETALQFDPYSEDELCQIMDLKAKQCDLEMTQEARTVARQVISRMRINPKSGNAGDVENLLNQTKIRLNARIRSRLPYGQASVQATIEPADIDPQWDRASRAEENRAALFEDFVGFKKIVEKFEGYQLLVDGMRLHDIDPRPHIPWAFIFKGPPGTGKTSTARKIGRLYYDMGLLSTDEVVSCSVTDIVGEYLGQTGPKVVNTLETGLGKVLFIDEAYRLATGASSRDGSSFHMEAVGELVDAMTQPRYRNNMVIILAGYTREMECLLQTNPGLRSRFPEHITFEPMAPHACFQCLRNQLHKLRIGILEVDDSLEIVHGLFESLSLTTGWASGRDVETLARRIISSVYMQQGKFGRKGAVDTLQMATTDLIPILEEMWKERS
ncbi:Stage V sporulation protein K [Colletotrichum siamense]|uniref:Stage V sporulation protein K n=1 Tax=Colletotrichum siamense TaxID=690259 RepID=A0A9P5EQX4_COLSI|nr:Stage V sporulation protein K [Colletotrichum siamense]KAF4857857.1 Stage V sporulation protein K [Colletotrichum siamense]